MNGLNLRWQASSKPSTQTLEETAKASPLISYILTQKKLGTSRKVIMENLMLKGIPYRNIRNAFSVIESMNKNKLDWRSPTAINDTARMIRNDIRKGKISYVTGMRVLIGARNNLKTLIIHPRDRRLSQMNQEINTTKKLLMQQYANPYMVRQYKVIGASA